MMNVLNLVGFVSHSCGLFSWVILWVIPMSKTRGSNLWVKFVVRESLELAEKMSHRSMILKDVLSFSVKYSKPIGKNSLLLNIRLTSFWSPSFQILASG